MCKFDGQNSQNKIAKNSHYFEIMSISATYAGMLVARSYPLKIEKAHAVVQLHR